MTPEEIAWVAGLFEGEGTFHFRDNRERGRGVVRRMTFSMTDEDIVRRFAAIVGVGKVYGPLFHKSGGEIDPRRLPFWRWNLDRWDGLQWLIPQLLPWLGERRRAAAELILANPPNTERKSHCKRGHPLDGVDADVYLRRNGVRQCRLCAAICRDSASVRAA